MEKTDEKDTREIEYKKFATREPGLTVLTDQALRPEQTYRDSFNMRYRLGPVFDIVRYPDTRTPMAIAVYGDWGTGKTTAMKWLHGLIDEWNKSGEPERKIRIRPVWFYPWKYHSQEDVWRGLVGEVILNSIDVKTASVKTVTEAFKMLGMFIGKSAIDLVSAAKIGVPGFELSGESIKKIAKDFKEVAHPEKPYLNPFEDTLKTWVKKSLGENQRMVVFVDDLDRCMPEIALQVLEALKLYLNIEKLIFVVGVDKKVIDKLVKEHYKKLGLDEEKSKNYLAKMFQVEVQVEPSEQQISDFLDEQLKEIPYWKEPHLSKDEGVLFRGFIFKLAERNPREVKRLINSALMMGAGAMMIRTKAEANEGIQFNQGLQLFFVRKILDDKHTMGSEVGTKRGIAFFGKWSEIVCLGREKDKDFRCSIKVPEGFGKGLEVEVESKAFQEVEGKKVPLVVEKGRRITDLSFIQEEKYREAYRELLQNPRFIGLFHLLADEDLGELMRIPYPVEVVEITAVVGKSKDEDIIREAIARQLYKKPEEVTKDDYISIKKLNLNQSEVSDIEPIKGLTSLQELYIHDTQVSNLEPIKQLIRLQRLSLGDTQVSDIEPIKGLTSLEWLNVKGTQVSDIEPIKQLTSLQYLDLDSIPVRDFEPLKGLTSLEWLGLSGTKVNDLEPLKGLTSLQRLYLSGTQVRDLEPIKQLAGLQKLILWGTKISDLISIKGLTNLVWIDLGGTQVSDLEPIKGLTSLQRLYFNNAQVSDLEPIKQLTSLRVLDLRGTQVSDLEPIKQLTNLLELDLSGTQVKDLEPIKGLTSLQRLYLNGTQVRDEQVASLKKALPELEIIR